MPLVEASRGAPPGNVTHWWGRVPGKSQHEGAQGGEMK